MEIPDLRELSPEIQKERFSDYTSFLESSLLMLVQSTDQSINQMARAILGKALKGFFEDETIKTRYDRALDGGYKSSAWQQIPTLIDIVANNMEEQAARNRVLQRFKGNKLRAYVEFSKLYAEAIRNRKPMEDIN